MALITLKEGALRVGIQPATARQRAGRGTLPAIKMGRDWFIEETTPRKGRLSKRCEEQNRD